MKKTLLAAALLAGFAGAASAQSSVTLYGIVDIGVRYQSWNYTNSRGVDVGTNSLGMVSGQESTSRWGLKGVEDIGGGNKASFVIETGIAPASGATNATDSRFRQSTIGLSNSSWGNFEMGRQLGLASKFAGSIDPFASTTPIANISNSFGISTVRYNNMLMYRTPNMSGFQAGISYSFSTGLSTIVGRNPTTGLPTTAVTNNTFSTMNNQRAFSLAASYANSGAYLFATYDKVSAALNTNAGGDSVSAWIVGGSYDAKVVKAALAYGQVRGGVINGQTTLSTSATGNGIDNPNSNGGVIFADGTGQNSILVALTAPIGSTQKVFASYQNMAATGLLKDLGAKNQNIFAVGYQYAFTKRTDLMAYYAYANNYQNVTGLSSNTLGVGLRHQF